MWSYRLKIHEIFKHKEWKKLLSMCISKILSNIEDIEPEYGVRLVKSGKNIQEIISFKFEFVFFS